MPISIKVKQIDTQQDQLRGALVGGSVGAMLGGAHSGWSGAALLGTGGALLGAVVGYERMVSLLEDVKIGGRF